MAEGVNPKDLLGLKKPPIRLVPPAGIVKVSRVFALGAKKYGPYNWRDYSVRYTVYLEAAMRHIMSALDGEEIDPESGQPHTAHAAACMLIVLDAATTGNLVDDRPKPGATARVIQELTEEGTA
jgi:dATP/dGTP diphosphohydrolase